MVDFEKLSGTKKREKTLDPADIFRRLPKPPGINDLYNSQAEVLAEWFARRTSDRDIILKLHTGGGKTLVGLLIAQSSLNETGKAVLYLCPTVQLVRQTLELATKYGIAAVSYEKGRALDERFVNADAVMIATYSALFNGKSKFGLRGSGQPQEVSAIICDDSHVAFSVVRDAFTLAVQLEGARARYESLTGLFRLAFKETDRLGTFDDVLSGAESGVLEVPYWAWHQHLDAVREQLKADAKEHAFVWPLLRDKLQLCHALISRTSFSITPMFPLMNAFPTFSDAPRRVFMSATISDDSEIVRTFDAHPDCALKAISSRSLAGVSERMILVPDLMPFTFEVRNAIVNLADWTSKRKFGAVILVPSDDAASKWADVATVAQGSAAVEEAVAALQSGTTFGPVVFASRYDGMNLTGDSCRLLVLHGLPTGMSSYELYRASALYGGATITRLLAQRIEQGMGRGARGAGDHCVVLLSGASLSAWVAREANFRFLTSATRAQLGMGMDISREVRSLTDLTETIKRSYDRDSSWTKYHAETLAELVGEDKRDELHLRQSAVERKAFDLWHDGYHEPAIARIEDLLSKPPALEPQMRGWMRQFAARIADDWGHVERADDLQREAYAENRNLIRPKVRPPYRPLPSPGAQERAIVSQIGEYRIRRGLLRAFEEQVIHLHPNSSAGQFESALVALANLIGLAAERHDTNGEGPDVLWLLPAKVGLVIEAKSRKKDKNALTKDEHGQLLVAAEWFASHYPEHRCVRVSVHPKAIATKAAVAGASHALTYDKLAVLVSDARDLLTSLCESQLAESELLAECGRLLEASDLRGDRLVSAYLTAFEEIDKV